MERRWQPIGWGWLEDKKKDGSDSCRHRFSEGSGSFDFDNDYLSRSTHNRAPGAVRPQAIEWQGPRDDFLDDTPVIFLAG